MIGIAQAQLQNASAAPAGGYQVSGLVGVNNSGTPNTQFDLSADQVVLRNSSDGSIVVRSNTGVITNNISTAGSTANGRDQAGAFSSSSWIHLYFIWNGTTLATLSSTVAPPTGPTLPSGYTHWAYCGAVKYNATPVLLPTRFKGAAGYINVANGGENRVLNAGTATTMTAIDCSGYIPPNSQQGIFLILMAANAVAGGFFRAFLRPTGSSETGQVIAATSEPAGVFSAGTAFCAYPTNSAQSIDYMIDTGSNFGLIVEVVGYVMPNGGE